MQGWKPWPSIAHCRLALGLPLARARIPNTTQSSDPAPLASQPSELFGLGNLCQSFQSCHQAQALAQGLSDTAGVDIKFEVADLMEWLPEPDASVDLTLCLYSVLSHIPTKDLFDVAREIARVTSGYFVTTVRSIGSTPSAFAYPVENVRRLQLNVDRSECELELSDGTGNAFSFRLFSASQVRDCFSDHFTIDEVRGLDVFHTRFSLDPRWKDNKLLAELAGLEEAYATKAEFIDRATHILLGARGKKGTKSNHR